MLLVLLCAGCASGPEAQPVVVTTPPVQPAPIPEPTPAPEPDPEPTAETRDVQHLVQKWRNQGLNAFARYRSTATTIYWTQLSTPLSSNATLDEQVLKDVARFAKLAGKPVQLRLVTTNRKDDVRLSQIIKTAAQQSGGKNNVKFDHQIETQAQTMIQLQPQESR